MPPVSIRHFGVRLHPQTLSAADLPAYPSRLRWWRSKSSARDCRLWAVVLPDVGMLRGSGRGYPESFVASDKSLLIVSSIRLVRVAGRFAE